MRKRDMSSGMFAAFAVTNVDCAEMQVNGPNCWMRSMGRSSVFFLCVIKELIDAQ